MSKASTRVFRGLIRLHYNQSQKPSSSFRDLITRTYHSNPPPPPLNGFQFRTHISSKVPSPRFPFSPSGLGLNKLGGNSSDYRLGIDLRFFYFKPSGFGKAFNENFTKNVFFDNPISAIASAFSRYREAIGLQIEAFCKRNYLFLLEAGGVLMCALLWRFMFGVANTFVELSEGMAKYGFLAFSSAIAFTELYIRSRFTINPDKVYRMSMRKLNTSAGILEVMGAPLVGSDLRAYGMSGGGLKLKNFKPTVRSNRCFLIFPIRGAERKGLVSVEVKKNKGQDCYSNASWFLLSLFKSYPSNSF